MARIGGAELTRLTATAVDVCVRWAEVQDDDPKRLADFRAGALAGANAIVRALDEKRSLSIDKEN